MFGAESGDWRLLELIVIMHFFQAARPIKTRQAKRQRQTKEAYKYTDKMR